MIQKLKLVFCLLLKGIKERRDNQEHQQQDQSTEQARHLRLAPRRLLDEGLGQSGAGGEAAEERRQDVAETDGVHLLVGVHGVAVLLGEHLRQRHRDGKAHDGYGEGVEGHVGDQSPRRHLRREEACRDISNHP